MCRTPTGRPDIKELRGAHARLQGISTSVFCPAELLDGMPGAYERAQLGLAQARAGDTVSLDAL